ncbi:MFS transporter [Bacteroides thetaiotaomicron]|uniref:MFS transporter n=1 Tax=Bacteroides thetaiotaomicron TaxID=818 RepID=A0A7J5JQC7_BACT4|nr:MFS transporter [Bacteroides thetaiotaomicron]KAB4417324.1 MFS transporter [Bacteroides thetaiotaomicron]KAB4431745.1 MFS transporter [Bacteroides thetaiotaomicron]KAB4438065.1 MFS transporter [Bacteroides thetaiotaomicron]KAB4440835.1 MFS transporter [Bacteroides thetaiotaomicron]KAB4453630.1 MFS transporter [Bacteroides thetaiotaomicron]
MNIKNQKVSIAEKIGYSLGDCSANLVFQMMMIYQTKFYTDIFGLEGAIAGTVMLVARIVDAFVDPTVGLLSDRSKTRFGKYRPWILWTALPFMVFYILAFYNPGIEDKGLVALYATISYTLLMTLYSFNNTPYASLGGVMSSDIKERTSITSIRFIAATIAQFVVQGLTLPLVGKFAENGDKAHGWLCTVSLFAGIGFLFLVITFFSTKERIEPPLGQKTNMRKDIQDVLGSIPWRAMFVLTLFLFITLAMWGSAMNYYFENYVDGNALYDFLDRLGLVATETDGSVGYAILNAFGLMVNDPSKAYEVGFGVFNMLGAVVQFAGVILLSNFLANRYGKRKVFICCLSLTAVFTALFYFPGEQEIEAIFILNLLKSLAYAPTVPLLWAMIADVADYSEYKNYRRATGFVFAGVVFALKAGLGIGGAILGFLLSGFGYISGTGAVQSETAVEGIVLSSSIIPAITFGIGILALYFYPITKQYNERMQFELTERRNRTDY